MSGTVLITGASRGIGRAAARLFAAEGWNVAVNYLHSEKEAFALREEIVALGRGALAVRADVRDGAQVSDMADAVLKRFGRIDALVCNAGVAQQKLFTDVSDADWADMMDVNAGGVFRCCRAVLPHMIGRRSGSIVTLSSVWGMVGASCEVHYSAAKAAVIGLTRALAKEVGPSGVRVNCVAPGVIETDMIAGLSCEDRAALAEASPLMRLGTAEEAAACIVFLASEKAGFVTGQVLSPNGGFII